MLLGTWVGRLWILGRNASWLPPLRWAILVVAVESIFGNVKGRELANHCGPDLPTLAQALRTGLGRVRRRPHLAHAFAHHAGLEW